MAEDVLQHHDGVVDDDADGERQGEQGEGVEREAEEVDDRHRAEERHRDGEDDVERLESEPRNSQQTRAVRTTASSSSNWISWTDSSMKRVESKLMPELHALAAGSCWISAMRLAHRLGDGDGVGAALLADAQALGRRAVDAGDAAHVLEAVLDEGDVLR